MIITLKRRKGMSHEEFVRYQREIHSPPLESIPETRRCLKRFVVSYPVSTPDYLDTSYDLVVEAWFNSMEEFLVNEIISFVT